MARRKTATTNPEDLTPREGKVLRYFVGRKKFGDNQTTTDDCIVETPWSDLPHSHNQAVMTISSLQAKGLLIRVHDHQHTPTEAGIKLMELAEKMGLWLAPPPPSVTNNPQNIDPVVTDYNPADRHRPVPKPAGKLKSKPAAKKAAKTKARKK